MRLQDFGITCSVWFLKMDDLGEKRMLANQRVHEAGSREVPLSLVQRPLRGE